MIDNQTRLINVDLTCKHASTCKSFEESLIKHASTVKHLQLNWKPFTNFLSNIVNLVSLDLLGDEKIEEPHWHNLENVTLPSLQILKAQWVPPNSFKDSLKI